MQSVLEICVNKVKIVNLQRISTRLDNCKGSIDSLLSRIAAYDYSSGKFLGKNYETYMEDIQTFAANSKRLSSSVSQSNTLKINREIQKLNKRINTLNTQIKNSSSNKTGR